MSMRTGVRPHVHRQGMLRMPNISNCQIRQSTRGLPGSGARAAHTIGWTGTEAHQGLHLSSNVLAARSFFVCCSCRGCCTKQSRLMYSTLFRRHAGLQITLRTGSSWGWEAFMADGRPHVLIEALRNRLCSPLGPQ
jgi:hypothetical protein